MYQLREWVCGMLFFALSGMSPVAVSADHILIYVDVSDSIDKPTRSDYYDDIAGLRFHAGDAVVVLPLGGDTHQFNPAATVVIPRTDPRLSPEASKMAAEKARMSIREAVDSVLREQQHVTYILGALFSANDYFQQENVPPEQRTIYIFSDMIEEANGMNFKKGKIPAAPPASLPGDLNATVHVVGVTVPPDRQEALRKFWEGTIKSTGSSLATYRKRL